MSESGFTEGRHLLRAGETLWKEGETADKAYLVDEGRIALFRNGEQIGELLQGELVGCAAVLLEVPQLFTVKGVEKVSLLKEYSGHSVRHGFSVKVDDLARSVWAGIQAELREVTLFAAQRESRGDPTYLIKQVRSALREAAEGVRTSLGQG